MQKGLCWKHQVGCVFKLEQCWCVWLVSPVTLPFCYLTFLLSFYCCQSSVSLVEATSAPAASFAAPDLRPSLDAFKTF